MKTLPRSLAIEKGDRRLLCEAPEGPFRQKAPVPFFPLAIAVLVCTLPFLTSGCGGVGDARAPLEGEVTLDGEPLGGGSITLIPLGDGFSAGGTIQDGKFHIEKRVGPSPGRYRVEIVSYRPTGKKLPDPDLPGRMTEEMDQIIPERYNRQSQLEVEVPSPEPLRFELQSR